MSFEDWVASLKFDIDDLSDEQKSALTDTFNKLFPAKARTKANDSDDDGDVDEDKPNAKAVVDSYLESVLLRTTYPD